MINAYRETVTKVINQFRDARLLDIDHSGITLLNPRGSGSSHRASFL